MCGLRLDGTSTQLPQRADVLYNRNQTRASRHFLPSAALGTKVQVDMGHAADANAAALSLRCYLPRVRHESVPKPASVIQMNPKAASLAKT